jgi:hypothetical protein
MGRRLVSTYTGHSGSRPRASQVRLQAVVDLRDLEGRFRPKRPSASESSVLEETRLTTASGSTPKYKHLAAVQAGASRRHPISVSCSRLMAVMNLGMSERNEHNGSTQRRRSSFEVRIGPKTRAILDATLPCVAKGTDPPLTGVAGVIAAATQTLSPFISPKAVVGAAIYTAKAMVDGKGNDRWEMLVENVSRPSERSGARRRIKNTRRRSDARERAALFSIHLTQMRSGR